jgi:hypothetical protein
MNKWYQSLIKEIENSGNRIFLHDPNGLLDDMNLQGDLSLKYHLHQYRCDAELFIFLDKYQDESIIFYSKEEIQRGFISNQFSVIKLDLKTVFPDLDINILENMDVSFLQHIYNYYQELKSQDKSMDTEQLIFKSVWGVDLGDLYSPTNNLKIALSNLIDDKDLDKSIIEKISEKLDLNIQNLKENKQLFLDWIEEIILDYISALDENKHPKYDLSNNLIQFYLSKIEISSNAISEKINNDIIEKEPWLVTFKRDPSQEFLKSKIESDISTFKEIFQRINKDEFDLNQIDDLFQLSKTFFEIFYTIQSNDWPLNDFMDIEYCYLSLNNLFKKLLAGNTFELLFNYPYNNKPYTVNRILDHIYHNYPNENIALILLDGMSYDEWFVLKEYLDSFQIQEMETFAILPTITSFSRASIFSGKVPKNFIENKKINPNSEINGFYSYLKGKGIAEEDILFGRIDLNNNYVKNKKENIGFEFLQGYGSLGLICNLFDDLSHSAVVYGEIKSNLYKNIRSAIESSQIVQLLEKLHQYGYKIVLASDHGNIFSKGNGIESNKMLEFEKRKSNRCLIFDNESFADKMVEENPDKCVKFNYNIISNDLFLVLATENYFFSKEDNYSITHGSFMPEEWIVPLVILK